MCEGADAVHESRLLRIIDTLAACGDVSETDAKLLREAVEDGLRARDLLSGHGAEIDITAEPSPDAPRDTAEVDACLMTFYGAFESMAMRRWANRWAGLGLKEE